MQLKGDWWTLESRQERIEDLIWKTAINYPKYDPEARKKNVAPPLA